MMRPRKKSNSFKESSKCARKELANTILKRRRSTLAQVLFGEKEERKREKEAEKHVQDVETSTATATTDYQNQPQSFVEKKGKNLFVDGFLASQFLQKRTEECLMRPKLMHVMVMGPKNSGKTAFLRVLAQQNHSGPCTSTQEQYFPTQEDDTYHIQLCSGGGTGNVSREFILFHDTPGIPDFGNIELKKAYLQAADAFLLFYSILDPESFNRVDLLKKQLEKEKIGISSKDKREVQIVVVGTKIDLPNRKVDQEFALHWANRERVKLFETSALDRDSLIDVIHNLSGKFFNRDTKFSLSRRLKPEKSSSQILMDF